MKYNLLKKNKTTKQQIKQQIKKTYKSGGNILNRLLDITGITNNSNMLFAPIPIPLDFIDNVYYCK